jgi:hypothetical protein
LGSIKECGRLGSIKELRSIKECGRLGSIKEEGEEEEEEEERGREGESGIIIAEEKLSEN